MSSKNRDRLIIFTRYPEAGKTKTRLISVLGEAGAATLQRQLTEHTITEAKKLLESVAIAIYYTGTNQAQMQDWLGSDLSYFLQTDGDLGTRMQLAFEESFALDFSRVVIIGIDCPDLNQVILKNGFNQLSNNDLVLGKAADGGYYLIGLTQVIPELFKEIPWGTDQVFAKTQTIAQQHQLKTVILPTLSDIDRPEDLPIWTKYQKINNNLASNSMNIRPVTSTDKDEWARMRNCLWPSTNNEHLLSIDQYFSKKPIDIVAVFVLERANGKLGGFIELNLRNYAEGSESLIVPYVEGWYVDLQLRGYGYGKKLMETAQNWALEKGFYELASDAEIDNFNSIAIHKALGFQEVDRIVCFIKKLI